MSVRTVLLLAILPTIFAPLAFSDVSFTGYGSIIAGQTLGTVDDPLNPGQKRDQILTADFYDVGQYDNEFSFTPESIFALQATADIGEDLRITAQLVAKGVDDFEPEFDWFYFTYQASENLTLMAGRRNLPMYYYSEFSEVGYAYPWMRPPSNLYWWQITQFNSLQAMYDFEMGDYSSTLTFFHGNERSEDNVEMKFYDELFGGTAESVDELWTDITGINWSVSGDNFDVRFVYFQNDRDRDTIQPDGSIDPFDPFSQTFVGFGGKVDMYPFTFLFDMNIVYYDDVHKTEFPTYLLSVVYNYEKFQPYIVYSKANQERTTGAGKSKDLEEHHILGVGVRYNLFSKASIKIQYDDFVDEGEESTGWAYHGDSQTLTIGLDFIFN